MNRNEKLQKQLEKASELASAGYFWEAIPLFRQLISKVPGHPELGLFLGKALGLSGQWSESLKIYRDLLAKTNGDASVLVRISRDLEEAGDLVNSRKFWKRLADAKTNQFTGEAWFNYARLSERCNEIDAAIEAYENASAFHGGSWSWSWLAGRLAERQDQMESARDHFQAAYGRAKGLGSERCASALYRIHDKLEDFEEALKWQQCFTQLRRPKAEEFPPPPRRVNETLQIDQGDCDSSSQGSRIVLMTGFPRSGTSLVARHLTKNYGIGLSEEFDFVKQMVVRFLIETKGSRKMPGNFKSHLLSQYWKSQEEVGAWRPGESYLLDKNPSLAPLLGDLLRISPSTKVLWMDRNAKDLWLSCSTLDVPMNPVSAQWNDPDSFANWFSVQMDIRESARETLGPAQFQIVKYETFVLDPKHQSDSLADKFDLTLRQAPVTPPLTLSPTYSEVTRPIHRERSERWTHYWPFLPDEVKRSLDHLD